MRVLISSWIGYAAKTGVGFYVDQLVKSLNRLRPDVEALAVVPPLGALATLAVEGTRGIFVDRGARRWALEGKCAPLARDAWNIARRISFRWACHASPVDLYHESNYIPLPFDGPVVTTVHDISVLLHPEWHPQGRVRYFQRHFFDRLDATTRFIADSHFTRGEMVRYLSIDPARIDVVPLAARTSFRPLPEEEVRPVVRRLGLPEQYLLFVGTVEPRKNLIGLLRAHAALPEWLSRKHPLVVVGPWGWGSRQERELLERSDGAVRWAGYIAEPDMPAVYNAATALVYPSFYEGFGLPPLEMMACGRPVIVSDRASLPEVVGSAGILVEPEDTGGIARAIQELLNHGELAEQLGQKGIQRARQFSWTQTAAETLQVYYRARDSRLPARAA